MKIKYNELVDAMAWLNKSSKKGDIEISFNDRNSSLDFKYNSNNELDITIRLFDSNLSIIPRIFQESWLEKSK